MAGVLSRQSAPVWLAFGLLLWSCSSKPSPGTSDERAGSGGMLVASGGSSTDVGGTASSQGGDGQQGSTAGLGGNGGSGGLAGGAGGPSEIGGSASGGTGASGGANSVGAAGDAEGGAGGSTDSVPDFEGHCGQGWAAVGAAAAPKLSGNVTPQSGSAGSWSFTFGRFRLVVDGAHGARVIEFSIDGNNLIDPTGASTFWPSPQQNYTWPPPAEIDSGAYKAQADATSLGLTSAVASFTGTSPGTGSTTFKLSVHKRFSVNANSGVVSIEYQLTNESATQTASWAPWEVTRVRAGGYTFAPKGPGDRTITQDSFQKPLPLSLLPPPPATDAIEWLNYPSLTLTGDNYINEFDGAEGWLAHANRFGTKNLPVLFVKSFVDAPDERLPPNQAEIQLWTSGTANPKLIEVEEQGALTELAPGASLTWTVHWSACELASTSLLAVGNADLAALARAHAVKP